MCNTFGSSFVLFIILIGQIEFIHSEPIVGDPNLIRSVNPNEYPPAVCISKYTPTSTDFEMICSGVLISGSHVLTIEQCLDHLIPTGVEIHVGPGDLSLSTSYYAMWWLSFEQWSNIHRRPIITTNNNIAIIKVLGMPIQTPPAVLSDIQDMSRIFKTTVDIYGCGTTNDNHYAKVIQVSEVILLRDTECIGIASKLEKALVSKENNLFCTRGYPFSQIRDADAGGPVVYGNALIGLNVDVIPRMNNRVNRKKLNTHIRISEYRDFIELVLDE